MLVTVFAAPPQGQQLSPVGRQAAVARRSISSGEELSWRGLGEARRHWQGYSWGRVLRGPQQL